MPVRCPDCRGLAYRHHRRERWTERSPCGLTREEAFAKARWKRNGWVLRAFYDPSQPRPPWMNAVPLQHAVQHESDAYDKTRFLLGPVRPVGPSWTSYVYSRSAGVDDGPDAAASGPPAPA